VVRALPLAITAVIAAAALGGCGRHGTASEPVAAGDAAPPAPGHFLSPGELDTQLGNGFRQGLYRLAVMSQPGDDAADLGQQLPTGTVRGVDCRRGGGRKWACLVRWETVDGKRESTRYAVDMNARGCFYASATPRLPEHYDSTIRTYSEHPLNSLQSLRRGC
jgi:hypothetical protein